MQLQLNSGQTAATINLPDDARIYGPSNVNATEVFASALESPLELPQVHKCVVSGDSVAVVIDPETPQLIEIVTTLWEQLQASGPSELDVTLLLPADPTGGEWKSLIDELPVHVRKQAPVVVHDPADEQQCRYLASSAGGERIYIAHHIVDADLIITVGVIGFDTLLGYRGTNSAIYPDFSNSEAIKSARGLGHSELTPDNKRPLRELTDEIGWLLGTQFAVQVIPAADGSIGHVFCGAIEEVMNDGQQRLKEQWGITADRFSDLAVACVGSTESVFGWKQLGAALAAASCVVEEGGRIAVVAELPTADSPGLAMLRRCNEPEDLLKPLSLEPTVDAIEVTQIIQITRRYTVYLLSNLADQNVEELGMQPLSSDKELQKLIDSVGHVVAVPGANFAWLQVEIANP